jgi:4-amino-4-deoxychorismate lyase
MRYFETIKILNGEALHVEYHQKRYEKTMQFLGAKPKKLIDVIKNPPRDGLFKCKIIYNKTSLHVEYQRYKKRDIKSFKLVFDDDISYDFKSTDRKNIDELFAKRGECDEIIIVKNDLITDTSIANLAFYKDGIWHTPKTPLLYGTTRERLLKNGRLIENNIHIDELKEYSTIALLNAMVGFYELKSFNYHPYRQT